MKLCLNMIVKNEAARIERCLASVAPYISSWCIVDTGSTDDTKNIINAFFARKKIKGLLAEYEFRDFSDARNYALERARILHTVELSSYHDVPSRRADYFLLVDADMELVVDENLFHVLTYPSYKIAQKNGGLFYWNVRLLRCDQRSARYIGATHEYLSTEGESPNLPGVWFIDHADGGNREGKFKRDADLLRTDVADKARSFYYLAQSLRDMGEKREAADAYGICSKIARWDEERWSAELNRARCLRDLGAPEWVDVALHAFGQRPTRAEPLYDLAKHFRERGLNEVSLLFSSRGLVIQKPSDLLFIENSVYEWGLLEEFAICAFYGQESEMKRQGRRVCNSLALDRMVPAHVRETARRNLFFYAQPLDELCPSFSPWRKIDSPTDWHALNPSICRLGDELRVVLRTVNYTIDEAGRYIMPSGETAIRTHNYLVAIEPHGSHRIEQDIPCELGEPLYDKVLGLEDMRLFEHEGELWYIATTRQTNAEGWAEQGYEMIGHRHRVIPLVGERRNEKNWLPIIGRPQIEFLYACDPTRVVIPAIEDKSKPWLAVEPPFACENFRGGSQLVPFDGGYLCLIHEAIESPLDGKRCYQHRFCWFSAEIELKKVSPRFWLQRNNQIEFAAGMCWHPDEERLVISYGIRDAEAWLGTVEADEVGNLLGLPPDQQFRQASSEDPKEIAKEVADIYFRSSPRLVPRFDREPGAYTVHGADLLSQCDPLSYSWALGQTNRPLRTAEEIDVAIAHLKNLNLPLHPDRPKNWDNLIAIAHAMAMTAKDAVILDAGGTRDSVFLPALHKTGYLYLTNWNIDEGVIEISNGIGYYRYDITDSRWGDAFFGFVACLSVIEHGVDVRAFFREMARVIKPGGHLFVSFDYWDEPIDCGDRVAFGAPVRIFTPVDVESMIHYAADHGLAPTSAVEYQCQDRVVEWIGLKYTFMNLFFRQN